MMSYEKRVARRGGKLSDDPKPIEGFPMPVPSTVEPTFAHTDLALEITERLATGEIDGPIEQHIALAIAEAEARGARAGIGGNNPPAPLLPEKLVDPEILPALFAENYGPLVKRSEELAAGLQRWKDKHLVPKPADWPEGKAWPVRFSIPDDQDNARTANFVRLLSGLAGGKSPASGEVNEAREKVKRAPLDACKVIDGWFGNLRDGLRADMQMMEQTQLAYMKEKSRLEQERRDLDAATALAEADRKAAEARAAGGTDEAVQEALVAEEKAEVAMKAAEAPVAEQTRVRTAEGTTVSLGGKWVWKVVSILDLAKAVIAGKVPELYLTANEAVIGPAVRVKNGLRECPGLEITNEATLNRSGRTS